VGLLAAIVVGIVVGRLGLGGLDLIIVTAGCGLLLIAALAPWALSARPLKSSHTTPEPIPDAVPARPPIGERVERENVSRDDLLDRPDQPLWDEAGWEDVPAVAAGLASIEDATDALTRRPDGSLQLRVDVETLLVLAGRRTD
jgi:hypothetical protein